MLKMNDVKKWSLAGQKKDSLWKLMTAEVLRSTTHCQHNWKD